MDAATRQTAQTLIDFYAGFAASDDEAEQRAAFETSLATLNEGDALIATMEEDGELTLDFTRLLLASGVAVQWLMQRLRVPTGKSTEALTFELRTFIDALADD
ncbi:hypothetical protein H9651_04260 [Microbacterium sp. Sa4CUA7]|uniref:TetR family transcriptional regulator n=1 Tax=Microbacterium pullorum TaxID=2762236 RepID=A0ABR8S0H5_9MICO|nr:hypothetical protein [Microbacterium pullorum]MBD7956839.1 hypothetical protein [Microbacterium pullorum]